MLMFLAVYIYAAINGITQKFHLGFIRQAHMSGMQAVIIRQD